MAVLLPDDSPHSSRASMLCAPDPVVEAYKRDLDRSLLRENLKLTVEQRFLELMRLQQFADELQHAKRTALHD